MDRSRLERDKSTTIDLKLARLPLPPSCSSSASPAHPTSVTLIDTPGHPDHFAAAIAGILHADVAVLVVDCRSAMLESPANGNQTRELGQLAAHLSANRTLVCAVNQMDTAVEAGAAEARYNAAVVAVAQQLRRRKESITFVPVSAYTGDNLTEPSPRLPWWTGPTLLEAVAAGAATAAAGQGTAASSSLSLRMPLLSVVKVGGIGTVALGRVASGTLTTAAKLAVHPAPSPARVDALASPITAAHAVATGAAGPSAAAPALPALAVRSIEAFNESRAEARAGECVAFSAKGWPPGALRRGMVVSLGPGAAGGAQAAVSFTATVMVLRNPCGVRGMREGFCPLVHVHAAQVACRLTHIRKLRDSKGKVPAADETVSLQEGDVAEVELRPERPLVVEAFKDCPTMGRFAMCAAMRVDMRGTLVWTPVIVGVGKIEAVSYTDGPEPHTVGRSRRQEKRGDARAGRSAAAAAAPQTVDSNGPKEDETREVIDLLD